MNNVFNLNHLSKDQIGAYIDGALIGNDFDNAKQHLGSCSMCFKNYVSMREGLFLMKQNISITPEIKDFVHKRIKQQKSSHLQIIIRFLGNQIAVSSGNQENLDFKALKASYSMRNSQDGAISITRTIAGRKVTLLIDPIPESEKVSLSIKLGRQEHLSATLSYQGDDIETLSDLNMQSMFQTSLPKRGDADIRFEKTGQQIFTITLSLENEG